MNEELVTTLANNIIGVTFFSFIGGLLVGYYATFSHYRQKERERKAVSDYINHTKTKNPPPSPLSIARKAMDTLQDVVTRYHIERGDTEWDYVEDKSLTPEGKGTGTDNNGNVNGNGN